MPWARSLYRLSAAFVYLGWSVYGTCQGNLWSVQVAANGPNLFHGFGRWRSIPNTSARWTRFICCFSRSWVPRHQNDTKSSTPIWWTVKLEELVDEWLEITTLDADKHGPIEKCVDKIRFVSPVNARQRPTYSVIRIVASLISRTHWVLTSWGELVMCFFGDSFRWWFAHTEPRMNSCIGSDVSRLLRTDFLNHGWTCWSYPIYRT